MKKILLYGLSEEDAARLMNALASLRYPVYRIGDGLLSMPVYRVFETEENQDDCHEAFAAEYMLFQDFTAPELLDLFRSLLAKGCHFSGVKILRTEMNENWTLRKLLEAGLSEHRLSRKSIILRELVRSCEGINVKSMTPEQQETLRITLMRAFRALEGGGCSSGEMDELIASLSEQLRNIRRFLN